MYEGGGATNSVEKNSNSEAKSAKSQFEFTVQDQAMMAQELSNYL